MKNLFKSSMLVAIVAAALVGCSKDTTETNAPVVKGTTVHFKAEVTDDTDGSRASLTPDQDETLFTAAWEKADSIGIYATDGDNVDSNAKGKYDSDDKAFSATFTNCTHASHMWSYYAYYPYVDTVDAENNATVPFGSARTQKGNAYNSAYDIMAADEFLYMEESATADPGKDDKGNSIVFAMHRLTAIAYFHFTTTAAAKSEKVLSVTLSATPSVAEKPLAADEVSLFYGNTSEKKHSCVAKTGAANSIKITYDPATAPTAADFKAWFNVLPGIFSDVKIAIETENYTATITRTGDVLYEAGKLYKVSTSIKESKWQEKAPAEKKWIRITSLSNITEGDYVIVAKTSTKTGYLPSATTSQAPIYTTSGLDISADSTEITSAVSEDMYFHFAGTTSNMTVTNAKGVKLYMTNTSNGIRIGTPSDTTFAWIITEWSDTKTSYTDLFAFCGSTITRYLGVYNDQDWRCYTSLTYTNFTNDTGSSKIYLYKKEVIQAGFETISNPTIESASLTTAKLQATWNKVTHATGYKWRLTTADNTSVELVSGTASNPASGNVVSLSEDVSTLDLKEGTQYVLYVKSVPATGYAVQGEEGKTDLTCKAAGGEVGQIGQIYTATFDKDNEHRPSGSANSYANNEYTVSNATWTLTNADCTTTGKPLSGTAHIIARVAKTTKNSPTAVTSNILSVAGTKTITKLSFWAKLVTSVSLKVYYSIDNGTKWSQLTYAKDSEIHSDYGYSANIQNVQTNNLELKFEWSVSTSTKSDRDSNLDEVIIYGY